MDDFPLPFSRRKKIVLGLAGSALLLLLALAAAGLWWAYAPIPTPQAEVQVRSGDSAEKVGLRLNQDGMALNSALFGLLAKLTQQNRTVQIGYYALPKEISPRALLELLSHGPRIRLSISIPEGWTFAQMRARINAAAGLKHDTEGLSDLELVRRLDPKAAYAEGWFFPSTYQIDKGSSDLTLYRLAYAAMQKKLAQVWQQRDPTLPLSNPEQLLILGSIVEKETGHPDDRPQVAAVFVNRLRIGMRLQTDPTVIYGMGAAFQGNLRRADLNRDTPYNSYTRKGLPPTPIALPGEAALRATTHPAASKALYFVAKGDRHSAFSDNLSAHNRAVKKFQLKQ